MIAPPFLKGTEVHLRALTERDCQGAYLHWFNDPEVCRFNGHHLVPYQADSAREYVRKSELSTSDLVLAIVLTEGDRHIGNVSLQNIHPVHRTAEFAIVLGEKDCWGKGYSKQAARLILDHGFLTLNLRRVECGTADTNVPMKKLAEFLGMKEEGRRRQSLFRENRYLDVVEYGVLKEEYLRKFPEAGGTR